MKFGSPLKELGSVDESLLANAINSVPDTSWRDNQYRQQAFDVHYKTESIVMMFCNCDAWPKIQVTKESGWDLLHEYAMPLMQEVLKKHYPPGGKVIRAMAAKLPPASIIKPHVDAHPSFTHAHRIHIPITSDPKVRFTIGGKPFQLKPQKVYEINNQLQHSVMNKSKISRITFIFDYIPPDNLSNIELTSECSDI